MWDDGQRATGIEGQMDDGCVNKLMDDGWMEGWTNMDGWMDGWIDG